MGEAKKLLTNPSECFVLMPFSDPENEPEGHFRQVYKNILAPACEQAGFRAVRADDVHATNLIHLDILQRLLEAPVALCDLSSKNPNVLFELGLRQAFDKPVVLVQEEGTTPIFDIAPLRVMNYRRTMLYQEVMEDQARIAEAIRSTVADHAERKGVNSLVKLLSVTSATLPLQDVNLNLVLQIIQAELSSLRSEIRSALKPPRSNAIETHLEVELESLEEKITAVMVELRSKGPEESASAALVNARRAALNFSDELVRMHLRSSEPEFPTLQFEKTRKALRQLEVELDIRTGLTK